MLCKLFELTEDVTVALQQAISAIFFAHSKVYSGAGIGQLQIYRNNLLPRKWMPNMLLMAKSEVAEVNQEKKAKLKVHGIPTFWFVGT